MASLKAFASLGAQDRRLLMRALCLVSAIRLGLFVVSFQTVQRLAIRTVRSDAPANHVGRCVWATLTASRFVPRATCLTRALAAHVLLTESGHKSHIEIGVTKDALDRFKAHAWVVCGDEIVIGGEEAEQYVPLAAWDTTMGRMN